MRASVRAENRKDAYAACYMTEAVDLDFTVVFSRISAEKGLLERNQQAFSIWNCLLYLPLPRMQRKEAKERQKHMEGAKRWCL